MTNNKLTDERLEQLADGNIICKVSWDERIALAREILQRRAADNNYFMYGIAEPDGSAYMDEVCVSHDLGTLQTIVDELNLNEGTDGYRIVALYTALPLTDDERAELQEYREASKEVFSYAWKTDRSDVDAAGYYRPEHLVFAEKAVKQYGGEVVALYAAPQMQAELESLCVNPMRGVEPLCVKLPPLRAAEDYHDEAFDNEDMANVYNSCILECEVRIKNAGVQVEGGE